MTIKFQNYMRQYAWILLFFCLPSTIGVNNPSNLQEESNTTVTEKNKEQLTDEPVVDDAYIAS